MDWPSKPAEPASLALSELDVNQPQALCNCISIPERLDSIAEELCLLLHESLNTSRFLTLIFWPPLLFPYACSYVFIRIRRTSQVAQTNSEHLRGGTYCLLIFQDGVIGLVF